MSSGKRRGDPLSFFKKLKRMHIRFEQINDIEQIKNVHLIAFETDTEANIVDALRNAGVELISLVAEKNGEIIGHILFSPVMLDGAGAYGCIAELAKKRCRFNINKRGNESLREVGVRGGCRTWTSCLLSSVWL